MVSDYAVPCQSVVGDSVGAEQVSRKKRNIDRKQSMRQSIVSRPLTAVGRFRKKTGAIVNHKLIQRGILAMIIINGIMMGVGTFRFVLDDPKIIEAFDLVDQMFLIVFTIESIMQFVYFGFKLFTNGWLVFDLVIVVVSWSFPTLQIVRSFRIFRALRLVRAHKALNQLVGALLSVIPRMFSIAVLLLLLFYIFSVLFTNLYKEISRNGQLSEDYFGSLDASLFTLFQMLTFEWAAIVREVMTINTWAWFPFLVYVMASGFIVFNLVIAVICDAVSLMARDDEDNKEEDNEEENHSVLSLETKQNVVLMKIEVKTISNNVAKIKESQQEMRQTIDYLVRHLQMSKAQTSKTNAINT